MEQPYLVNFSTTMLILGAALAVLYFGLKALRERIVKRVQGNAPDDSLRFVRALSVGTKERVVIVEHRGERWMLGVTTGAISTIAHWSVPSTPATQVVDSAQAVPSPIDQGRS